VTVVIRRPWPREEIKGNPNVLLVETDSGGHLGWTAGAEAPFGGALLHVDSP
jgi:predicted alpha/beta-fold hydrolase